MGIRAAAVAVMAAVLALSACSQEEALIVGDSADADGEVNEGSVSNEVRLDDLIGSVWLIVEVSDGTTINDDLGGTLSFIGWNDEPALFVGGPCGGGALDVEPGESGIRIVRSTWDANCTGCDLQALFAPDTALELAISEKVLTIWGMDSS